jgi:hypothetical protein
VQYGLGALVAGEITMAEFLKLNFVIGAWKDPADMVQEGFPFLPTGMADFDVWNGIIDAEPAPLTGRAARRRRGCCSSAWRRSSGRPRRAPA